MNPISTARVFVTDDALGSRPRSRPFAGVSSTSLDKNSNVTTGKIYWSVLQKNATVISTRHRTGHSTLQTKSRAVSTAEKEVNGERIAIVKSGGTVGVSSQPFWRQSAVPACVGHENAILSYLMIPCLKLR